MTLEERLWNKEISLDELLEMFDESVALELASEFRLPQSKG